MNLFELYEQCRRHQRNSDQLSQGQKKIQEQQLLGKKDASGNIKSQHGGIGDRSNPQDKLRNLQKTIKKGPLANVAAGIKAFVKGQPEPLDEQTTAPSPAVAIYNEITKAWEDERDYIVLTFADGRSATMIRGQIWNAIVTFYLMKDDKRRAKYVQQHLQTFETFMPWLASLQRYKVPAKRRVKQQSLDLQPQVASTISVDQNTSIDPAGDLEKSNLREKKSNNNLDSTDVRLSRQLQTARARFPSASSDLEAGILDQMERQDQGAQALAQQQADINRQDQQVAALTQANQTQLAQIRTQGQEIDRLTQRVQQVTQTGTPVSTTTRSAVTPGSVTVSAPPTARPDVIYVPDVPADTAQQDAEIAKLNQKILRIQQQLATASVASQDQLLGKIAELEKDRAEQEAKKQATAKKPRTTSRNNAVARKTNTSSTKTQGQLGLRINLDPQSQAYATAAEKQTGKSAEVVAKDVIAKMMQKPVATTEPVEEGQMKSQDTLRRELEYYGDKRFGQIYNMTADQIARIKKPSPAQDTPMSEPRFRDAQGRAQLEAQDSADVVRKKLKRYLELALAANRAGDDEKTKLYQQKIQSLKQKLNQDVAEADDLQARIGQARVNKTARSGQTDMRNIPVGNRADARANQFTNADRQQQRDQLKAKIKASLGKQTGPNLPEGNAKLSPQLQAHQYNLDAAQREMDRRHAEGEDMTDAKIDKKTYEIIKPKPDVTESLRDYERNQYIVTLKSGRRIRFSSSADVDVKTYIERKYKEPVVDIDYQGIVGQPARPLEPYEKLESAAHSDHDSDQSDQDAETLSARERLQKAYDQNRQADQERFEPLPTVPARSPGQSDSERDQQMSDTLRQLIANLARRKQIRDLDEDHNSSAVESAIIRRIMVAHTDLLMQFGPEKVMQAAEEVADSVGHVDEIGTSDVSAYVAQVRQQLGAADQDRLNEKKWSARYKSSINCANPKGFSQKAHCAGKKKS